VKTDGITNTKSGGAALLVHYKDSNNTWIEKQSTPVNGTVDWKKTKVTFTVPMNAADGTVIVRTVLTDETGAAYYDGLILEGGVVDSTIINSPENRGVDQITTQATYTPDGRFKETVRGARGDVVKYSYDNVTGNIDKITLKNGTKEIVIDNDYDINNRLIQVAQLNGTNVVKNGYSYKNDRLETITSSSGVRYSFIYDEFGNQKDINIGKNKLITKEYDIESGNLLKLVYGNGDIIENLYDGSNNIKEKKINGEVTVKYYYNNQGNIGLIEDIKNGVSYKYIYDLADRLINIEDSTGNSFSSSYDISNLINKEITTINGVKITTGFEYDKDSKINKISLNSGRSVEYKYDKIGRNSDKTINLGNNINYQVGIKYLEGVDYSSTKLIKKYINNGKEIIYDYDELNRVKSITREGKKNI
ncbi:MAG: hypothetical protein ACRC7N_03830, partial [Clostridium sp.]